VKSIAVSRDNLWRKNRRADTYRQEQWQPSRWRNDPRAWQPHRQVQFRNSRGRRNATMVPSWGGLPRRS